MKNNIKNISFALVMVTGCGLLVACGGGSSGDSNPPVVNLTTPNTFSFAAQSGVPLSSIITSAEITVSGINTAVPINVVGGEYSVNNATFTADASQVVNGNKVRVRHTSAAISQTAQETRLTISGVSAVFRSTTADAVASDLQVSVNFPLDNTKVYADQIVVYGNASSDKGIENIKVNGINATLQMPTGMVSTMSSSSINTTTTWSAVVPLASASNTTLTVNVTEGDGAENDTAAILHISNQQPPIVFTFDSSGRRLIGQLYAEGVSEFEIISIDVETDEFQVITRLPPVYQPLYISASNSVLFSTLYDHTYTLYSLSVDTAVLSTVFSHTFSAQADFHVSQLPALYDAENNALYVSFVRVATGSTEYGTTELYSINLVEPTLELIAGPEKGSGGNFLPVDMIKAGNKIIVIDATRNYDLISLDPSTGDRVFIAETSAYSPMKIAVHPEQVDTVYVAGLTGIATLDLVTGTTAELSADADYPDYNLSQIASLAVDLPGNRLLIGESDFNYVMATDLSTGARSTAYSAGVGEGRKMFSPTYLAYDATNSISYVWDYSGNNTPALLEIDMTTGDRVLMAEIDGVEGNYAGGLHLDSGAQRLITQYPGGILAYNLETAEVQTLTSAQVGTGPLMDNTTASAFDEESNVLWVAAKQLTNQLYRVDLTDLSRELITFDGSAGSTGSISGLTKLTLDKAGNRLFMADSDGGQLYQLNLTDMSFSLLNVNCKDIFGRSMLDPDYYSIGNMYYDSKDNDLYITGGGLIKWDLDAQSCDVIDINSGVFDLAITPERRVMATRQNRLMQLDITNNQEGIISR